MQSGVRKADRKSVQNDAGRRLEISLGENCSPPTEGHKLLLGFHFGSLPTSHNHPAIVSLRLQPFNGDQLFENWWYKGDITYTSSDHAKIAECQDYTVVIVQKDACASEDFRAQTRQAYLELLDAVKSTTHTKLIKVWNYFDNINHGENDLEKYRQFSIGRAEAFQTMRICDEDAPTGTAIGTQPVSGLALIALASNRDFFPVENPRQTSAFHYPRKYGPSSPKFSRGGFVTLENHKLVLISGTAAVVGHESSFPYDTAGQTNETFKNLAHLCDSISEQIPGEKQFTLNEDSVLRVYLKNQEDYWPVAQKIDEGLKRGPHNIAYLQGTICRQELMLEIDGVKVM